MDSPTTSHTRAAARPCTTPFVVFFVLLFFFACSVSSSVAAHAALAPAALDAATATATAAAAATTRQPQQQPHRRYHIRTECGMLDLAPFLTDHRHVGGMLLLSEVGPVDLSCRRRARESAWLVQACAALSPMLAARHADAELLFARCEVGARKLRRSFHTCAGVGPPPGVLETASVSRRALRADALFCTFTADCGLDAFTEGCADGFPLVRRLFDFCAAGDGAAALDAACRRSWGPEGLPVEAEVFRGVAGLNDSCGGGGGCDGSGASSRVVNRTFHAENLRAAIDDAKLSILPRLRPFLRTPVGYLPAPPSAAAAATAQKERPKTAAKKKRRQRKKKKKVKREADGGKGEAGTGSIEDLLVL